MTSATERLREMLDARGVECWDSGYGRQIVWQHDGVKWFANDSYRDGVVDLSTALITPEQAIAATLGNGRLTVEQVADAVLENFEETHETRYDHWEPSTFDWQEIADELNAALGAGECGSCKVQAAYDELVGIAAELCRACGFNMVDASGEVVS